MQTLSSEVPLRQVATSLGRRLPPIDHKFQNRRRNNSLQYLCIGALLTIIVYLFAPSIAAWMTLVLVAACLAHSLQVYQHNIKHDHLHRLRKEYRDFAQQQAEQLRGRYIPIQEVLPSIPAIAIPTSDGVGRHVILAHNKLTTWVEYIDDRCAEQVVFFKCYYDDEGIWQPGDQVRLYLHESYRSRFEQLSS